MAELPEIASLWIGGRLSWLEQLCLVSFAHAGHKTTLYSYSHIDNVPDEVEQRSAEDIFPSEPMHKHARTGSPAIHADLFRLNLLKKTDQIWVDADMYCRQPFDFGTDCVFGWEKPGLICNAVLGLPRNSPALDAMLEFFKDEYAIGPWLKESQQAELKAERDAGKPVHMTEQNWGFTGPAAVTWFLEESGEATIARPQEAFYPISFKDRNKMILTRFKIGQQLTDETYGVHFWARRMKPRLEEKHNGVPRGGSYLDGLIGKHKIDPSAAPIPTRVKPVNEIANDPVLCAKIALEGLKGEQSIDALSRKYLVEKQFIKTCISTLTDKAPELFKTNS
ncbi:hypothetical protein F9L33_15215 [Amylibacter sp. SFDW26]|uniref:hypothetical protein n=1 Tax=Amylibacter sp. SFDW26 TaxID=2652722 RepID=UPI0012619F23|nr:hypothetical protein [Amylibacter sp. SFDW26]KAB7610055.1 hypothetical protein F9L33_15215 [Amylibacter sp. SFDW26]